MESDQHLRHPTLHTEGLTEREREVVAAVLADRLRGIFVEVLRSRDGAWDFLLAEWTLEREGGEGPIRSRLGVLRCLCRALGAPAFDWDDVDRLRRRGS